MRSVQCPEHGPQRACFICHHLSGSAKTGDGGLGFFVPDVLDDDPQAWCAECDAVLRTTGGEWNDESEAFADIAAVCERCFARIRLLNQVHP
jgi:hypothetical protein